MSRQTATEKQVLKTIRAGRVYGARLVDLNAKFGEVAVSDILDALVAKGRAMVVRGVGATVYAA